ncbi:hypothetical protein DAI22_03g008200 [Oryza sativa Japonica Group]|nr:hypothetical protein DAI22_03g008200 [Oryza sativa Japonica Group]
MHHPSSVVDLQREATLLLFFIEAATSKRRPLLDMLPVTFICSYSLFYASPLHPAYHLVEKKGLDCFF